MESFLSFLFAVAVTFFFVRRYLKTLTAARNAGGKIANPGRVLAEVQTRPCPRCQSPVPQGSSFCPRCGAALAIWTVQRAATQSGGATTTGAKPRPLINTSLCIGCGSCVESCPVTGTLGLVSGKAILSNPDRCTGHAKCSEVCPTQAITLSHGGVLQTVRVPHVKENFESNVEGLYVVGELAGMCLIKTAINQGKLVVDQLKQAQLKSGAGPESSHDGQTVFDILIVGAGPAGLSAALTAHQYGLKYLALEQGEIASTIRQYPRHKFLMAEPIEIPLYGSLYIGDGTKEALLSVWETILSHTGVRVQTNERVESVKRNGGAFLVKTGKGQYHARKVLLALGRRGTPRHLGVPGEDLSKVSYRLIEADTYADRDILVVGGGDSAIEAALALCKKGKNRVTLSYRGDNFHRARQRNQAQLEASEKEGRLRILRNSHVVEILADSVRLASGGRPLEIPNHFAFIMIGGNSPEDFLKRAGIEIVEKAIST